MRNDKEIIEFIMRFKAAAQDHLRGLVLKKNIMMVSDFLYIPRRELQARGCGNSFFLEFKKALGEIGYRYDADSVEDIEKKISERPTVNNEALLKLRFKVLERDGFRCQYCGRDPKTFPEVKLQIDHVRPDSKGGLFIEENLTTSCQECNLGKGDVILTKREGDNDRN
jgi:5-methylcytosine-specific restriction endonuclease McrA